MAKITTTFDDLYLHKEEIGNASLARVGRTRLQCAE